MQVGIFEATVGLTTDMHDRSILRVLAICGSLRAGSSNRALLDAATLLAPVGVEVSIYQQLDRLPAFNPDLDTEVPPRGVAEFRSALYNCDAVLISSPEYAHGVPGVLKNTLDWVVGSGEFIDKPVAVVNASTRATHAWKSLTETLTVMSVRVIDDASVTVPLDGKRLDGSEIAANADLAPALMTAMKQLIGAVRVRRP
jgi:NAD(P)H-dependent FMN reductase